MAAKRPPKTAASTRTPSDRSNLRLSEVARHVVYPPDIVTTEWPRVEAKCRDLGVNFDEWQKGLGRIALGKREDGKYAATIGGVVLSIPRQVGKTYTIGNMIIALCLLHPNLTVLWTAQRIATSTMTFESMQGMVNRPKIKPFLKQNRNHGIRTANGEQRISFHNGSVVMFGSRDNGFGRGFSGVDVEVFDEAQMLKSKALDDMVPATNQSTNPAGALLFFMGTPPRPLDLGDEFRARRKKALSGKWHTGVYVEMSADKGAARGDRVQVMKANPSVPHHTPWESIDRMDEQLTEDDAYFHEALGIWDDDQVQTAFVASDWAACFGEWRTGAMEVRGLALAVSRDMDWSSVVVAAPGDDGTVSVRPVGHDKGTAWTIEALRGVQEREGLPVVVDPKSPADALIPVLEREGIELRTISTDEAYTTCSSVDRLVLEHRLRHASYDVLNDAVTKGRRRFMRNGRFLWERKSGVDTSALEAMTLAAWQADNPQVEEPTPEPFVLFGS